MGPMGPEFVKIAKILNYFSAGRCRRRLFPSENACLFNDISTKYKKMLKFVKIAKILNYFSVGRCRRRLFPSEHAFF